MAQNMLKPENNIDLKKYNTYYIGGKARYLVIAESRQDLIDALNFAKEKHIFYVILGKGSNVLISDSGYKGLVIVNRSKGIGRSGDNLHVESGTSTAELMKYTVQEGLAGVEFLAGIPGSFGGAILGNAGAWGKSLDDIIESVEFMDKNGIRQISKEDLDFSYRDSSFKKMQGIILGADIILQKSKPHDVGNRVREILLKRSGKHPVGRSCGSYFKNVDVNGLSKETLDKILEWEINGKIPASKLIEDVGGKGMSIGDAEVSNTHANFLINKGNATADDIKKLAEEVKREVFDKFGIELEPEVRYL